MVWDEQEVRKREALDATPVAGLFPHPGFGEFGRKTESHQICYFFSPSLNFKCLLLPAGLEIPQKQMLQCSTASASNLGRNQT